MKNNLLACWLGPLSGVGEMIHGKNHLPLIARCLIVVLIGLGPSCRNDSGNTPKGTDTGVEDTETSASDTSLVTEPLPPKPPLPPGMSPVDQKGRPFPHPFSPLKGPVGTKPPKPHLPLKPCLDKNKDDGRCVWNLPKKELPEKTETPLGPVTNEALTSCIEDPSSSACQACPDPFYGHQIYVDPGFSTTMSSWISTEEFVPLLEKATGQTFSVSNDLEASSSKPAIIFLNSTSSLVSTSSSSNLKEKIASMQKVKNEAFVLHVENGQLWIVADRELTLKHAAYAYLDRLGYRWYGSTDTWTIRPSLANICLSAGTEWQEADFESFYYFGSGAYGNDLLKTIIGYEGTVVDGHNTAFRERNRFPIMYMLAGHSYENFLVTKGKDAFASTIDPPNPDPLYFAEVAGVRTVYNGTDTSVKFDYTHNGSLICDETNATVVYTDRDEKNYCENDDYTTDGGITKMFSDFSVELLRDQNESSPDGLYSRFVSVDPSDGGGHCECQKCKYLLRNGPYEHVDQDSSVSDRVFHLANITAKKISDEFGPDFGASLYAYNLHGAVPTIPLERNLHVMAIPNAFNYTGLSAEVLLQAWADKSAIDGFGLGIYDYGALSDWFWEVPAAEVSWPTLTAKIPDWKSLGLKSVLWEESTGIGVAGLTNLLFSRLAWDATLDPNNILAEYYDKAFGPAKEAVKNYYELLNSFTHNQLTAVDVGNICHAMVEADAVWQTSPDTSVGKRLDDLKKYTYYLQLAYQEREAMHDLQANYNSPDYTAHLAVLDKIMEWIWRIHDSEMIMSYALHTTLFSNFNDEVYHAYDTKYMAADGSNTYDAAKDAYVKFWKMWDRTDDTAEGWARVAAFPELTTADLNTRMQECAAQYPTYNAATTTYSSDYVALFPETTDTSTVPGPYLYVGHQFKIVVKEARTVDLKVAYSNGYLPGTSKSTYKLSSDYSGDVLFEKTLADGDGWLETTLRLEFPEAGQYTLEVESYTIAYYLFYPPKDLPIALVGTYYHSANPVPETFYFVPGVDSFLVQVNLWGYEEPQFLKPDGTPASFTKLGYNLYEVNSKGSPGVWSYKNLLTDDSGISFIGIPQALSWSKESLVVPADTVK